MAERRFELKGAHRAGPGSLLRECRVNEIRRFFIKLLPSDDHNIAAVLRYKPSFTCKFILWTLRRKKTSVAFTELNVTLPD